MVTPFSAYKAFEIQKFELPYTQWNFLYFLNYQSRLGIIFLKPNSRKTWPLWAVYSDAFFASIMDRFFSCALLKRMFWKAKTFELEAKISFYKLQCLKLITSMFFLE